MQTRRRIAAVLIFPAIAYVGAACERMDTPTQPRLMAQFSQPVNLVVDADGMAIPTDCNDPTPTFSTIQAAINAATPNQKIGVCPATYPEIAPGPLTIDKTLTLLGAQSGVDARNPRGPESIIADAQGTSVSASNVVIDGFTVQHSIVSAFTGFGIWLNPNIIGGISGTQILNNIIQDNIVGIGLANSGASQAVIRHNLIQNNNVPGPATGQGIYTDQFAGGTVVDNVLIEENAFIGNNVAGIDVSNTNPAGGAFNLDVSTNSFDMNGRALLLFNTHMSTIHDNSITNSTLATSAAIRVLDNNTNLTVVNNDLATGAGHAIAISFLGFVGTASSDVVINQNNIGTVGSASFAGNGLLVSPAGHDGTVDAKCNWWGAATGPTNPSNPGGMGEEVVGDADFTPWLTAPAPGGPCIGGLPSGKVTGGGQIDVVTGGRGSFGFNAKSETQSGHLNYVRHATPTTPRQHLNCMVDFVAIDPSTTKAELRGTCSGDASSFTAEVEDHGVPGKGKDKFKITYNSNTDQSADGTIRSGNVQIKTN